MYNSIQIGAVVAFVVTYFIAFLVLFLRYFQALRILHKIELDLGMLAGSPDLQELPPANRSQSSSPYPAARVPITLPLSPNVRHPRLVSYCPQSRLPANELPQ